MAKAKRGKKTGESLRKSVWNPSLGDEAWHDGV
jgi:hypothetical protein